MLRNVQSISFYSGILIEDDSIKDDSFKNNVYNRGFGIQADSKTSVLYQRLI